MATTAKNTEKKKTYSRKKNKATANKNVEASSKESQKNVESKALSRDVKYLYPTDKTTKPERKAFRANARATFRSFEKKIAKADAKEQKTLTTEFNKFKKETFVDGVKATIGR